MSTSVSLLKPAMPTAPTTSPATRIGMPPRSAAMLAVTNAVRPRLICPRSPPSVVVAARLFVPSRSQGPRLPAEHRPSAQKPADLRPDQPPRLPRAHGAAVHLPSLLAVPSGPRLDRGSLH